MIDTRRDPYFDDFDPEKNFVKVLFKPGYPIQVRELNQLQSIQHHQMAKFSEHIFKHGSMIEGQGISKSLAHFVTIQNNRPDNNLEVDVKNIPRGSRVYGETSRVEATIILAEKKDGITAVYLNYIKSGVENADRFYEGENLIVVDDSNNALYVMKVRCPECEGTTDSADIPARGTATIWNIPDSVYYVHGYFVTNESSMIVGERFSSDKEIYEVGFRVEQDIVTVVEDPTLYDNTLGYPNQGAPGADRARVRLIPEIRYTSEDNADFIVLAKMTNGMATYMKTKTEYSAIMDMIAQRTYDESGNYTVVPFRISVRDHVNRRDNGGLYTLAQGGDDSKFVATVSPGKGYIRGYQLETIGETPVTMDKARDTKVLRSYYTQFSGLSYILIRPEVGSFPIANDIALESIYGNLTVDLHDGPTSGGIATGNVIGTLRPYDVEIHEMGDSPIYKLYITEVAMNDGNSFTQVRSMKRTGTMFFNAVTINDALTERPKIYNNNETTLVWHVKNALRTTRDADNNDIRSLSYTGREKFSAILDGSGTYSWNANRGEYFLPFNPLTTIAAFVSDLGVSTVVKITNQVSATSGKLSVNFGSAGAGKRLVLLHSVMKSGATEKKKVILRITDTNRASDSSGRITLRKSDLYSLISVKRYSANNPATKAIIDISALKVDNGHRDYAYVPAAVILPSAPENIDAARYEIVYDYLEHSEGDFFSIDSYKDLLEDDSVDYIRADIPVYKSKNGMTYNLSDCLDFRPLVLNDLPVKIEQPMLNGQIITDVEFYLPRIDLLIADRYGKIFQKKGESSETPAPPKVSPDGSEMAVYEIHQEPYVLDLTKGIRTKFIENKRYTMRDIGRLEQRLENVEYYTTFSMMELNLEQTSVKDEFGFDRFKNGFLADNFSNFQASNLMDPEFRASIDRADQTLRPSFKNFSTDLEFDEANSTNFRRHGNVVMLDYNEEILVEQPYCTKDISVNPYFIFSKEGKLIMDPPYDNWVDINQKPDLVVSANLPPVETERPMGQDFGSWSSLNKASVELGNYATDMRLKPYMRSIPVKFYATGMKKNVRLYAFFDGEPVSEHCRPLGAAGSYGTPIFSDDSGNVRGEFLIPAAKFFVGQKDFVLTNDSTDTDDEDLLFTRAEGIFWSGGVDLTKQETTLNIISPLIAKPPTTPPPPPAPPAPPVVIVPPPPAPPPPTTARPPVVTATVAPIVTVRPPPAATTRTTPATTRLPATTKPPATNPPPAPCFSMLWHILEKFGIPDPLHSKAKTYDPSQSVKDQWKSCKDQTGFKQGAGDKITYDFVSCMAKAYNKKIPNTIKVCDGAIKDPVAQSFMIEQGSFITAVDIFFSTVASDDLIFVWIAKMLNGYPTKDILGEITIQPHECLISSDGTVPTNVRFPIPIYLETGNEYSVVVGGRSPDTRVWISKLGQPDKKSGVIIETQPTLGSFFKSQNSSTWTASQYEDLKFTLYRARFKHREGKFSLRNKPFSDDYIELNPFETQAGSSLARIRCENHAMNPGDSFRTLLGEHTALNVQVTSGEIQIGQTITTGTGSGVVSRFEDDGSLKRVFMRNIQGYFLMNQPFTAAPVTVTHPSYVINTTIRIPNSSDPGKEASGSIKSNFNPIMNGIPMGILNTPMTVVSTDSVNSFVVNTGSVATSTGFVGGSAILNVNKRYDGFNLSGSYLPNGAREEWFFKGIGHKINGLFEFDDYRLMPAIPIELQKNIMLNQPMKYVNNENAISNLDGGRSIVIEASFTTPDDLVSPTLNVDTFSFIGISNTVDFNESSTYNVSPNGTDRLIPETHPGNGSSLFKYITRDISLVEPALDLRIFLDVHKGADADFDIYVKKKSPEDFRDLSEINWIKVQNVWKDFVCERDEYREVDCSLSELIPDVFDGVSDFNMFRIKIVGRCKNTSLPPLFKMLRVIAVT